MLLLCFLQLLSSHVNLQIAIWRQMSAVQISELHDEDTHPSGNVPVPAADLNTMLDGLKLIGQCCSVRL